jgi:hypothetical protein
LSKVKIIDNPDCTFCHTETETVQHLMWNCNFVKTLIEYVNRWFLFHNINITFNKTTFIFGETSRVCKGDPYNIIYLCIKQYIYNTRCLKKIFVFPSITRKIERYNIENMLAVRNKWLAQFSQTWNIYKGILYWSFLYFAYLVTFEYNKNGTVYHIILKKTTH